MPEGHTLHRLAIALNEAFAGRTIAATSPQGRFTESAATIDQTAMIAASAHGKHLFCEFDCGRWLHVHLGPSCCRIRSHRAVKCAFGLPQPRP